MPRDVSFLLFAIQIGALVGCAAKPKHFHPDIQSENAGDRILAIRNSAEIGDRSAIPLIVDRLDDEDGGVRFFAILALERLVGTRLGYDYAAPFEERVASVERWRNYIRRGRHATDAPVTALRGGPEGNHVEDGGNPR